MNSSQNDSFNKPATDEQPHVWRYVHILMLMQAVGAAAPPIIISLGGLVGAQLATNKAMATLPVSLYNIGLAVFMLPVALLINRLGRQQTYVLGTLFSFLGGIVAAWGIYVSSFELFCIGTLLAGAYGACVQSYRFAITDYVPKLEQPLAISRVMLGGLAAAIIGPQLAIWGQNIFDVPLVGSFLSQSVLAVIAFFVIIQLGRVTSGLVQQDAVAAKEGVVQEPTRTLLKIITSYKFFSTAIAGLVSYGLMVFLMTATPMAIREAGYSLSQATLGVQWHILGMYVPSFFTGRLVKRFGARTVTISGLLIIACACMLYLAGSSIAHFWAGFILLGVGWNLGFIGATSLVTECYVPSERTKVQALNDTLVFGTTASASLLSGQVFYYYGWERLNILTFPIITFALLLLVGQIFDERRYTQD